MTSCLRMPVSLDDAAAIVEACGGPGWRVSFMYGLGTVAVVAVVAFLLWGAVRVASHA